MQLVEQLRLKRTDAKNLLSSRKRKLKELYTATTYTDGRFDPKANDEYFQLLQAFQDANDLEKGRAFDEKTLPPQRAIVRPTPASTPTATSLAPKDIPTVSKRSKSPAKLDTSPSSRASEQPRSHLPSPRSATPSKDPVVEQPPAAARDGVAPEIRVGNQLESDDHLAGVLHDDGDDSNIPDSSGKAKSQAEAKKQSDTPMRPSPQPHGPLSPNSQKTGSALPPTEVQEPQSSPASTNGLASSNTPAPEVASPSTSPGDDALLPSGVIDDAAKTPTLRDEPQTPNLEMRPPVHKMSISSLDVDMTDADPSVAFESPSAQSINKPSSPQKEAVDRKPNIRVDTQGSIKSYFEPRTTAQMVETPVTITANATPAQTPLQTPGPDSARRATRIQSGVLQKKSVSEILGETPRSASPHTESALSPSARAAERDRKEKERSKLSTVVFAKPTKATGHADSTEVAKIETLSSSPTKLEDKDYMYTLFESKAQTQSRQGALSYLLQHSHKSISTADHLVDYNYQASCRVLKRLYQLQNLDKWALRQRKRADEPPRPTSHWDFLLDHAKWMRTDFREERRWKIVAARMLAEDCAAWVNAPLEERKALQITVRSPKQTSGVEDVTMSEVPENQVPPTPGLDPSGEDDSVSEDIADPRDLNLSAAPAAIFSLGAADINFATEKTPALDKLLDELPLYQPSTIEPDLSKSNLAEKLDRQWKTDIVPVSKYATEKLKVVDHKPPMKRSRYDYEEEDESIAKRPALEPRGKDVALFMPENKHIRDRIHPGHSFRPPSEHPMPAQAFFETRQSSQWLSTDDDEVRKQAREYSFNWQLISELLTPKTLFVSGQDRRSAWECFERWIYLEGMPADMSKTPYFRTYSSRIETAQKNVQAQWEELERRNGTSVAGVRKKTTLPVRVERKHNRRHLFMLDAMRKLSKKREVQRHKAMQSADLSAVRKSNDAHVPRPPLRTPAEWSAIKSDREQKIAKQQELYRQQLLAHQAHQRAGQTQRGTNGAANGVQVPQAANGQVRMPIPNGMPVPNVPNGQMPIPNGQQRPHPNMMAVPQGMAMQANMMASKGMPNGQMPGMARAMAGSPQQLKAHQEQLIRQAQQHAQQNGHHSSPNMAQATMANGQNANNGAFMMNQSNAQGSPPGNAASPRPNSSHMGQSLSSGSVPKINQLYASIKARNPNMSDEEVSAIATQQLFAWQQQATAAAAGQNPRPKGVNQAAINAAVGAANSGANFAANMGANNGQHGMMDYNQVQQYNQRMRLQQAQAQQAVAAARGGMQAPNMAHGMMNNSPVMNMARPVSQHSQNQAAVTANGMNRSQTPREQRSGSASTTAGSGPVNNVGGQGGQQPLLQSQQQATGQQATAVAAPTPTPMQT